MPRLARPLAGARALAVAATLLVAPAQAEPRAPNLRPAETTDEGGIWSVSDKTELKAKASAERNRDPALNAYVSGLACKLAAEYCGEIRVYVMDRPFLNASMAPNGYTEVWSGLLLRAQSEDELAFVLGHEIGHFVENHTLESWRATKSRAAGALALQVVVTVAAAGAAVNSGSYQGANDIMRAAGSINDIIYLGTVAAYFSYSRDNESEADALGFRRMAKAGYDPTAPAGIWRAQIAETEASSFKKVREQPARASIFNSHPLSIERVKALDTLAAGAPAGRAGDRKAYRAVIRPHLAAWLKDDLRRRDYGESLALIGRLEDLGEDQGVLAFYRGEAYRQRREGDDLVKAREAYVAAGAHADAPLATWRVVGDLALQAGDTAAAKTAYETYLVRAPAAQDRWLVEASLKKLSEGSAI
ncbi:putative Zn-dependent protease [Caulobacter sp. AP07]|uniref:M48 family metallopeptidase n=1 Tax=Caulobacter sp. AP07 TaxID=1144304 RepID=UPI0002720BCC|nr:M48 family metallopeptidase [Caulobacter sp. AP07]EJL34758.1 putative Zn-dependent protease [Caulobacter sp. AP07]